MAASHVNGLQAKYEQDVADYTAVLEGDTLPVQARVEAARPSLEVINLAKAITSFRIDPANQADLAEAAATSELRRGNMADQLINTAMRFLGVPYRSGQSSPSGFDCSGFMQYIFRKAFAVNLPRTSAEQANVGVAVNRSQLQPGDMVFFRTAGSRISHVGMYIGNDRFIHAPRTGRDIEITSMNGNYWKSRYITARRVDRSSRFTR